MVNNAGIFEENPLPSVDYPAWQSAWARLSTNRIGSVNATCCVTHQMIRHGGGKIIIVLSRTAYRGNPRAPAYVASKAGLDTMSQSLAIAFAPHRIFPYVVAPSVVRTDMAANVKQSAARVAIRNQSLLGRGYQPDDVAHTAAFLAAPGLEYLTSSIIDLFGAPYPRT